MVKVISTRYLSSSDRDSIYDPEVDGCVFDRDEQPSMFHIPKAPVIPPHPVTRVTGGYDLEEI